MQDEEDGDEIPDEDEAGVGAAGAAKVTVTVPTDFTLSESCQELLDTLCGVRCTGCMLCGRYLRIGLAWPATLQSLCSPLQQRIGMQRDSSLACVRVRLLLTQCGT